MALFKKKANESTEVVPAGESTVVVKKNPKHHADVIVRPRITEKAAMSAEKGVYSFEVTPRATKITIAAAVKEIYKVTPVKVNIVNLPVKKVFAKGKRGTVKAVRKAYVYLNEGDKIEFV
jgi:large subunit ribosomal protein L23